VRAICEIVKILDAKISRNSRDDLVDSNFPYVKISFRAVRSTIRSITRCASSPAVYERGAIDPPPPLSRHDVIRQRSVNRLRSDPINDPVRSTETDAAIVHRRVVLETNSTANRYMYKAVSSVEYEWSIALLLIIRHE